MLRCMPRERPRAPPLEYVQLFLPANLHGIQAPLRASTTGSDRFAIYNDKNRIRMRCREDTECNPTRPVNRCLKLNGNDLTVSHDLLRLNRLTVNDEFNRHLLAFRNASAFHVPIGLLIQWTILYLKIRCLVESGSDTCSDGYRAGFFEIHLANLSGWRFFSHGYTADGEVQQMSFAIADVERPSFNPSTHASKLRGPGGIFT